MARSDRLVVRATLRQWNERTRRAPSDIAYFVYLGILVAAIVMVPIFRAAWLLLSEPPALALLSSPSFGTLVVAAALLVMASLCAPWAAPAVRRALLASVLSSVPLRLSHSFGGPVARWCAGAIVMSTVIAALIQGVLWSGGFSTASVFVCVVASAIAAAAIATVLAVMSQQSLRVGVTLSCVLLGLAVLAGTVPLPVGFFADTTGASVVAALALITIVTVPWVLDRMHPQSVVAASLRRDAMTVGLTLMDSGAVADAAHEVPSGGRRRNAVPRVPFWLSFAVSAAIGATRTPTRLARGVVVLVAGMAIASSMPTQWGTGAGATLVYLGLGFCMAGVEQAAHSVRTTTVYGLSDATLVALHTLFPAAVVLLATTAGFVGGNAGVAVAGIVGGATLLARVFAALTPPAPLSLLIPMPTPMGDVAALLRLGWALQGVLFAIALSIALLPAALGLDAWPLLWAPPLALAALAARWNARS